MGSRKTRLILAGVLALALLAGGSVVAWAADGAAVIKDGLCGLPSGVTGFPEDLYTSHLIGVVTPSGNVLLSCHFDFPKDWAPAKTVKITGITCGTHAGSTTNSQVVLTPGGKALLRCEIKAPAVPP